MGYFLPFYPLTAQKIKILKKWKNTWRYHHFTYVYQKLWSDEVQFWRYGAQQMDGQKKGHTEVGARPLFVSFIIPFSRSFLISLYKISTSVLFLGCWKFELPIGCWLKLTFKPCCTILSMYLLFVSFFQFSKWNFISPVLNFSARSCSF